MAFTEALKHLGSLTKMSQALAARMGSPKQLGSSTISPIAIDFGTSSLKVLQVSSGDPPTLIGAACDQTPEEFIADPEKRLQHQISQLSKLLKSGCFKGKRAVCGIPGWATVCKHVQLQRIEGVSTTDLVSSAVSAQFGKDPSQLVYRFVQTSPVDKPGARLDGLIIAVERDLVQRLMGAVAASKLDPVGMHSEFASVLYAFEYVHKRVADLVCNTLYLDIGYGTTDVAISHGKDLAFARIIDVGGGHLDATLSVQLECDRKEARRRRLDPQPQTLVKPMAARATGKGVASDIDSLVDRRQSPELAPGFSGMLHTLEEGPLCPEGGDVREPLEMLTDEIRMCLRFHGSQYPDKRIDRVIFIGGESRHRGLCQQIAKALKLPAQIADPLARIARTGNEAVLGLDIAQPQPGWCVPLGLCLGPTDL
jgi:type IV pilus assembly protein PilM